MKSKLLKVSALILSAALLTGCYEYEEEGSGVTLENETSNIIGENEITEISDKKKTETKVSHKEKINEQEFEFVSVYAIDEDRAKNWYFTQSSSVDLGIKLGAAPEGYDIKVSQIYADISLLSPYARYNGIRQDSINVDYYSMTEDGYNIDSKNGFNIPFQIEGVDKSETFFYIYNGYGSTSTHRITESDIAEVTEGAVLNVVWTLTIENTENGKQYVKTINDRIGIPYNRIEQETEEQ